MRMEGGKLKSDLNVLEHWKPDPSFSSPPIHTSSSSHHAPKTMYRKARTQRHPSEQSWHHVRTTPASCPPRTFFLRIVRSRLNIVIPVLPSAGFAWSQVQPSVYRRGSVVTQVTPRSLRQVQLATIPTADPAPWSGRGQMMAGLSIWALQGQKS